MQQKVTEAETEIKRQEDIKRQNERDLKELSDYQKEIDLYFGRMNDEIQFFKEVAHNPDHPANLDVLIQNFDCALSHPDANDLEYKNPLELNFYPVQEDFLFFTFLANSLKDYNFSNFSKNAT